MDRTQAMTKLLVFAKTRAEDLRATADREHLDDVDLHATERIAAELDEAARVLAIDEGAQLIVLPKGKACLPLSRRQVSVVNRALACFSHSLQIARDTAIISHETFCGKADRARAVQLLVWALQQEFEDDKRGRAEPAGGPEAQD